MYEMDKEHQKLRRKYVKRAQQSRPTTVNWTDPREKGEL